MPTKFKERIPGGLASGKSPSEFSPEDLAEGILVELEHTTSRLVATEIAMDHLTEDPLYYKKLKKIERIRLSPVIAKKTKTTRRPSRIPQATTRKFIDPQFDSPAEVLGKSGPLKVKRAPKSADLVYVVSLKQYRSERALLLRAFDRSKTQKYRGPQVYRITPTATEGPMYVGEVEIREYRLPSIYEDCYADYLNVLLAVSQAKLQFRSVWNISWSSVCKNIINPDGCEDDYLGMGVATAMYAKALELVSTPGSITLLIGDACKGSSTSPEARRVYSSLLRSYIGSGLVVTNARYGTALGRKLLQGASKPLKPKA